MAEKANTGTTTGSPAPVHVPAGTGGTVPAKPPRGPVAEASAAPPGDNRGGKPRADGLVPGSPQAKEADRKKDADRKKLARTVQSQANPPPLPSPAARVPGTGTTPANGAGPVSPGTVPGQSVLIPWDPTTLQPLLEEIINGAEEARVQKRRTRAVAVGLTTPIVEQSVSLARFPGSAKAGLAGSGANGVAKMMNGLCVSGKFQDVAIAVGSLAAMLIHCKRSDEKFEELIAEFKKAQPAGPPEKKP